MSFTSRLKTGFEYQEKSVTILLKNSFLVLYWLVPALLVMPLFFYKPAQHYALQLFEPTQKSGIMLKLYSILLMHIPIAFIVAACMIHLKNILNHQKTSLRTVLGHIITLSPWIILAPFVTELLSLIAYLFKVHYYDSFTLSNTRETVYFVGIHSIEWIWSLFTFYILASIVLDRTNIVTATHRSITFFMQTWVETLCGTLCIRLAYLIVGFLITAPLQLLNVLNMYPGGAVPLLRTIETHPLTYALVTLPLTSILLVLATFQVLMYKEYNKK